MKIKGIFLWLVLMPTIIFIDVICFIMGIFSRDIRRLYVQKFYGGADIEMLIRRIKSENGSDRYNRKSNFLKRKD